VIIIDIDLGGIGRAFRTGEIDPVCLRWSSKNTTEEDKKRNDKKRCSFHVRIL
jgi:hypothetical protein